MIFTNWVNFVLFEDNAPETISFNERLDVTNAVDATGELYLPEFQVPCGIRITREIAIEEERLDAMMVNGSGQVVIWTPSKVFNLYSKAGEEELSSVLRHPPISSLPVLGGFNIYRDWVDFVVYPTGAKRARNCEGRLDVRQATPLGPLRRLTQKIQQGGLRVTKEAAIGDEELEAMVITKFGQVYIWTKDNVYRVSQDAGPEQLKMLPRHPFSEDTYLTGYKQLFT